MTNYEVHEKRLSPDEVDYLQSWIDEHCRQDTREAERDKGDGLNVWRGLLWALPVGLVAWAVFAWVLT